MRLTRFQKLTLGVAGLTAISVGTFILTLPHAFYTSYGINLGPDPDLLSELRAPGAALAAFGGIMLSGLFYRDWVRHSIVTAMVVFFAFPVGRIVGILADGMPSGSVTGALAVEVAIGLLLFLAFGPSRRPTASLNTA